MRKNLQKLIAIFCLLAGMTNIAKAQSGPASTYSFSATTEPFAYLTGATTIGSPYVQNGYTNLHADDVYAHNIPIGFSFLFCGNYYTTISASSNGFISFNPTIGGHYLTNGSLSSYPIFPAVMVGWDDLGGSGGNASFKTEGVAPNRTFIIEFKNWQYRLGNNNTLSFQIKLFEGGMIKLHYKQEAGTFSSSDCTIGICGNATDYLVLPNVSSNPVPSSTTFTTTINARPADNQVYTFGQPPCPSIPTNVTASNITATKATIAWNNVSAPQGYQYVIDQSSGNPSSTAAISTNNTSINLTGLNPGTTYWAHVRGVCSGISQSNWVHKSFTTTTCVGPNVSMANITAESATAVWNTINIAQRYEYILSQDANPPTSGTSFTTNNTMPLSGLVSGTQYYFHIRSICANNELSDWNTASFNTMLPCVPPTVTVIDFSAEQKKATWQPVPTAVAYEWAVTSNQTPPSLGKNIYTEEVDIMLPPDDGKGYYLHVRTNCVSIFNASEWGTVTLRQPSGTAISNVNMEGMLFNAYPSPVKDVLTINLDGLQQISGNISIAGITGKVVYTTPVNAATIEVNMSAMAPGVYFIKYSNQNNTQTIKVNKL